MMKSWKTTAAGALAIVAGLIAIGQNLLSGHIDPNLIYTQIGVIAAGITGLVAKDNNVTGAPPDAVAHPLI